MSMKSTISFKIIPDLYQKDEIMIHPNVGFDIDLLNPRYEMKIFPNSMVEVFNKGEEGFVEGSVVLDNKCEDKIIRMKHRFWKKIGMPKKARIFCEDNKLLLAFG